MLASIPETTVDVPEQYANDATADKWPLRILTGADRFRKSWTCIRFSLLPEDDRIYWSSQRIQ